MLRVSKAQGRLLTGHKSSSAPHVQRRKQDLPENQVAQQIIDFLRLRSWTLQRQPVGKFVAYHNYANSDKVKRVPVVSVGEKGMTDWIAMRPEFGRFGAQLFFLEIKAPGKSPRPDQIEWMHKRRIVGFDADWFDSFDTGRKPFLPWYRQRFGDR